MPSARKRRTHPAKWAAVIVPSLGALGACGTEPAPLAPRAPASASSSAPPRPPPSASASAAASHPSPWIFRVAKPGAPEDPAPAEAPRLSRLVPIFRAVQGEKKVPTKKAVLFVKPFEITIESFDGECLVDAPACGVFRLSGEGVTEGPFPLPQRWTKASDGQKHVYAYHAAPRGSVVEGAERPIPRTVDRISPDGTVTPLGAIDTERAEQVHVVELAEGAIAVATHRTGIRVYELSRTASRAELPVATKLRYAIGEGPLQLGEPGTAQSARYARSAAGKAVWGPLRVVALEDANGKRSDRWAIVLVEVVPPPIRPLPKNFDRNGCGSMSRLLSADSTEKVVHVLRFQGAKLVSDKVVHRSKTLDQTEKPLRARALPSFALAIGDFGVDAADSRFSRSTSSDPERPDTADQDDGQQSDPVRVPDDGTFVHLAWSAARSEGSALVKLGETTHRVSFDASGRVVEGPTAVEAEASFAVGGEWALRSGAAVTLATGAKKGAVLKLPSAPVAVQPGDEATLWFAESGKLTWATLSATGVLSPPKATETAPNGTEVAATYGGRRGVVQLPEKGGAVFVPTAGAPVTLYEPAPEKDEMRAVQGFVREVFGDVVVVAEAQRKTLTMMVGPKMVPDTAKDAHRARWLGADREVRFSSGLGAGQDEAPRLAFPSVAGTPFADPASDEAIERGCTLRVWVGPRRVVTACRSGVDPVVPGVGGGLRVVTY